MSGGQGVGGFKEAERVRRTQLVPGDGSWRRRRLTRTIACVSPRLGFCHYPD